MSQSDNNGDVPLWLHHPSVIWERTYVCQFIWLPGMTYHQQQNASVRFALYLTILSFLYFNNIRILWAFIAFLTVLYYIHYYQRSLWPANNTISSEQSYEQTGGAEVRSNNDVEYGGSQENWNQNYGPSQMEGPANETDIKAPFYGYSNDLVEPKVIIDPACNQQCKISTPDNPFGNNMPGDRTLAQSTPLCDPVIHSDTIEENFKQGLFSDVNDTFGRYNSQRQYVVNPSTTIPNDRASFMKWCWDTPFVCKDGDLDTCFKSGY